MEPQNETMPEGTWTITELEVAARDMVDIGVWEAAEEEEYPGAGAVPTPLPAAVLVLATGTDGFVADEN